MLLLFCQCHHSEIKKRWIHRWCRQRHQPHRLSRSLQSPPTVCSFQSLTHTKRSQSGSVCHGCIAEMCINLFWGWLTHHEKEVGCVILLVACSSLLSANACFCFNVVVLFYKPSLYICSSPRLFCPDSSAWSPHFERNLLMLAPPQQHKRILAHQPF